MDTEIVGVQTPSVLIVPDKANFEFSNIAFSFLNAVDFQLMDWQRLVLKHWFSLNNGQWASSQWGLSVPRQNGKNYLLEARELVGLTLIGEKIIHTAHSTQTAKAAFDRLLKYFEDPRFPELCELLDNVQRSIGKQSFSLKNGASILFLTRTKNTARGFTIDTLICDEAQEFSEDALSALLPTTAAAPLGNRQIIYTGTPPSLVANSEIFTRMRDRCLDTSTNFSAGWMEWAASEDDDVDDPKAWAKGNPSLGLILQPDSLANDSAVMSRDEFYRERLGAWTGYVDDQVIPTDAWLMCVDQQFVDDELCPVALAVDINSTRDAASIVACGRTVDAVLWVEVIEHRTGRVDWVLPKLISICKKQNIKCICIDGRGNAATVIEPLKKVGLDVTVMVTGDIVLGCAMFYDAVISRDLVHLSQPSLSAAVAAGRKRVIGDAWGWSRGASSDDITPLVAASYAVWGQQTEKFTPVKRLASVSFFY